MGDPKQAPEPSQRDNVMTHSPPRAALMRALLTFSLAFVCWSTATAQTTTEAGKIILAIGETRMAGQAVKVDDSVPVGAELSTGANGYLYLKTIDNGFLILRPGSVATVEAYEVNRENPEQSRFKFVLRQGIARSISGEAVAKARKNFRFNTPVAAIGVRGTDFSVFADVQETRVIVTSGGVVMAGFDALCSPQGSGPCEGANSVELFANASASTNVLTIKKGQGKPQLHHDRELSPDLTAPPRLDEPQGKAANERQGVINTNDAKTDAVSLEPIKKTAIWGRWQAIANDLPATVDKSLKPEDGKEYAQIILGSYILFREQSSAFNLPSSGAFSFALQDVNLAHVSNPASGASAEATLANGALDINFTSATFATRFDLKALGETHPLYAMGNVTQDGIISSTPAAPGNMTVRGFLYKDGQRTDSPGSATYLFRATLNNGWEASGVANWGRK